MAGSNPTQRRLESMAEFMARRAREVAANANASARALVHDAYGRAIRLGQDLNLPTVSEVEAFVHRLADGAATRPKSTACHGLRGTWYTLASTTTFEARDCREICLRKAGARSRPA